MTDQRPEPVRDAQGYQLCPRCGLRLTAEQPQMLPLMVPERLCIHLSCATVEEKEAARQREIARHRDDDAWARDARY